MTITKFIAAGNTYTFPTSPGDQDFRTNFANMVAKSTRMPGADGGFDEYGFGRAASEIGNVPFGIFLVSPTRAGMKALRDGLKTIVSWGKGRLIDNQNGVEQWAWGRINSIDANEQRHQNTDLFQTVKLSFQVSDPYWYTAGNETVWGSGALWGNAATIWGGSSAPTLITNSGTISKTNNGSADTYARLTIKNSSGSTVYDPIVRRIVNGAVVDEVKYTGALLTGMELAINPLKHSASIAGVSVLGQLTYANSDWLKLAPGVNALQVYVEGQVNVYVHYFERYI